MREARDLTPREAAYRLVRRYFEVAGYGSEKTVARLLAIPPKLVASATQNLERERRIKRAARIESHPGEVSLLLKYTESS
jgi:hypothetical protein